MPCFFLCRTPQGKSPGQDFNWSIHFSVIERNAEGILQGQLKSTALQPIAN